MTGLGDTRRIAPVAAPQPDVQVRIGGLEVVGGAEGGRLVTVGLGSCVGIALVDLDTGAAGLAHVFLPAPPAAGIKPGTGAGTYATTAVPELVERVVAAGPSTGTRVRRRPRLSATIAGGARMFAARGSADVGERNVAAVEAALVAHGVAIVARDVGGAHGRTMRVRAGVRTADVTVRQVGSPERTLWAAVPEAVARAA